MPWYLCLIEAHYSKSTNFHQDLHIQSRAKVLHIFYSFCVRSLEEVSTYDLVECVTLWVYYFQFFTLGKLWWQCLIKRMAICPCCIKKFIFPSESSSPWIVLSFSCSTAFIQKMSLLIISDWSQRVYWPTSIILHKICRGLMGMGMHFKLSFKVSIPVISVIF